LVTQQLGELATGTVDANNLYEETQVQKQKFDLALDEKVQALQDHSDSATKLEPLKELIKDELTVLRTQIQTHKKEEKVRSEKTLQQFAQMNSEIAAMKKETQDLESSLKKASTQAFTDKLTQLPNRLAYEQRFNIEFSRWQRNATPVSLLLWDIDFFKKINDTYGHSAGDKTLSIIASLLQKYCRETDFVSRFGGEEFTMLLSNTDKQSAKILAEKIRKIIERTGFTYGGKKINITISCGIAELVEGDTQDKIFNRADKALYSAKKEGRNCSVVA
ncbi:MAG: GGDEF domain-containing protein, partial [Methyloprofundus sp.]|nr:GGDEF domain-containing protein [Methyloprofundus sp.]